MKFNTKHINNISYFIFLFIVFLFENSIKEAIADIPTSPLLSPNKVIKKFSCPAKTFILGEYITLAGKPALLVNTSPRFELHYYEKKVSNSKISATSPSGRFLNDLKIDNVQFVDPYGGRGGVGLASAQFLLSYAMIKEINSYEDILNTYKNYNHNGSGADIVTQWKGGIVYYNKEKNVIESFSWPFKEYGFYLIKTGKKLKTVDHLNKDLIFPTEELAEISLNGVEALMQNNITNFAKAINDYSDKLNEHGLVEENTVRMIDRLKKLPGVIAAKGCGAMGADIIFVLMEKKFTLENYEIIATEKDIDMKGLLIE